VNQLWINLRPSRHDESNDNRHIEKDMSGNDGKCGVVHAVGEQCKQCRTNDNSGKQEWRSDEREQETFSDKGKSRKYERDGKSACNSENSAQNGLPQGKPCDFSKAIVCNDVCESIHARATLNDHHRWDCQENQQIQGWSND
jgi:hypothetical protein